MIQIRDLRETKYYQEVMEEGREEGREQERKEFAARLLAKKFPLPEVAELTGLSVQQIKRLKKKNGR